MAGFAEEQQGADQAAAGDQHRIPEAVEDVAGVHHQGERDRGQEAAEPAVADVVRQRQRGIADAGREQFDHQRRQRAVAEGGDQYQGEDDGDHHRLVHLATVGLLRVACRLHRGRHRFGVEAGDLGLADPYPDVAAGGRRHRRVGQAGLDQEGLDLVAGAVEGRLAHRVELEGAGRRVGHHADRRLPAGLVDGRVGVVGQALEQREVEQRGEQQAGQQHRLAADAVGQPAGDDEERRAKHQGDDQQTVGGAAIDLEHLGEEEQHVELRRVEGHRLAGIDAEQRGQHHLQVAPLGEGLAQRRLADLALGLHLEERRRLAHGQADPGGDAQQDDGQQEWQAPAPGLELVAGQLAASQDHQQREQQAEGRGGLDPTGVATALVRRGVLGDVDRRAAVLAAQGQALEHAQGDQDDRRGDTDRGIGGQQADGEGRQPHQQDGHQEGVLAPDHVAQAAEHQRAEGPHQEAGGEGHQGEDEGGGVVDAGEELLADHRRQGAVEEEVVPLEDRAQRGGEDHLALLLGRGRRHCVGRGRCVLGHCGSPAPCGGSYCCLPFPFSASTAAAPGATRYGV